MNQMQKFTKIVRWDDRRHKFVYKEAELKSLNDDIFT